MHPLVSTFLPDENMDVLKEQMLKLEARLAAQVSPFLRICISHY